MRRLIGLLLVLFSIMDYGIAQEKLKVVTPKFQATGNIPDDEVVVITDFFITNLASAMQGKAEVIDRSNSDKLIEEQNLQTNDDLSSSDGRLNVQIANASHILIGQLQTFRAEIIVTIKIMDSNGILLPGTYTGRIKDVAELLDEMPKICEQLAKRIDDAAQKTNTSSTMKKNDTSATKSEELAKKNAELESAKRVAEQKAAAEKKAREEAERKLDSRKIYSVGDTGPGGGRVYRTSGDIGHEYIILEDWKKVTYEEALKLCRSYNGGGYRDWTLMDSYEARELSRRFINEYDSWIEDGFWHFKAWIPHQDCWIAKTDGEKKAYVMDMEKGMEYSKSRTKKYPVIAVRTFSF